MSYAEVFSLIFNDNGIKINAVPREIYETVNLKYAFDYIFQNIASPLTLDIIKEMGVLINKDIHNISGFRTVQVYIRGVEHIPPDACQVECLLSQLICKDRRKSDEEIFEYIARFHITFERIHPFIDGNGRVGRLLIMKELLMHSFAPVVIPLESREMYMQFLNRCDVSGLTSFLRELSAYETERISKFIAL